jgi:hypothetical protein
MVSGWYFVLYGNSYCGLFRSFTVSEDAFQLKDADGEELGRSHNASRGLVGKEKHDPYIEVSDSDEVFADLDEIIVAWLYLKENDRRDRGETS